MQRCGDFAKSDTKKKISYALLLNKRNDVKLQLLQFTLKSKATIALEIIGVKGHSLILFDDNVSTQVVSK